MRRKSKPKVYAAHAEYLDPIGCGSMIGFTITKRRRLYGEMDLSDCNRKINWYFENSLDGVKKIDKAIEILSMFKNEFVEARRKNR